MKETFGDNFYTEFMFHGLQMTEEEIAAEKLNEIDTYLEQVRLSKKYGVKMVCTNDSQFLMPRMAKNLIQQVLKTSSMVVAII